MLALRAGLDALVAAADREFDRLIVADLEVEKRQRLQRAPIAAVDCVVAQKIDRAGDMPRAATRHDQQDAIRHARADLVKERASRDRGGPICARRCPCRTRRTNPNAPDECRFP